MKFSLLNLFLAFTVIAAIVGLYSSRQAARRNEVTITELTADNKKLRQELGWLTIEHPEKLHAIQIGTGLPETWSYRVYLPKGRQYYFACQINSLPPKGATPLVAHPPSPNSIGAIGMNSSCIGSSYGEYIVTLSVISIDNKCRYLMKVREANSGKSRGGGNITDVDGVWPMVTGTTTASSTGVYQHKQTEISLDKSPLVLLDLRSMNGNAANSGDFSQGCMLWVGTSN